MQLRNFKSGIYIFSILVFILFVNVSCFKKIVTIKKGDKYYEKKEYYKAKAFYEKAAEMDTSSYYANLKLGLLLVENIDHIDESIPYLKRALRHRRNKADTIADILKAFGDYCFYSGEYSKAEKFYREIDGLIIDNTIKHEVEVKNYDIKFALTHPDKHPKPVAQAINLGPQINSYYAEYNASFDHYDEKLYFTARRPENIGQACDAIDGKYYEDMYMSTHLKRFNFAPVENFAKHSNEVAAIKNSKKHESVLSVSDNDSMLFTYKNNSIYISKLQNGVWSEPKKMDKKINKGSYQNHISIAPDNKTIYFSSNRKGGYGGLDLYMSYLKPDSTWSDPYNLGSKINTAEDEESIEIMHDGKTIIFASRGLLGYGGYDLFKTVRTGLNEFSEPEDLGPQINSPSDDIYLKLDSTQSEGYFSSDRRGSYGDMDIYRFHFLDRPNFYKCECGNDELAKAIDVQIPVSVKINDTFNINIHHIDSLHGHRVIYYFWRYDKQLLSSDTSYVKIFSGQNGKHELELELIAKCDTCFERLTYCFKKKIISGVVELESESDSSEIKITNDPSMPANAISLKPVYFNFSKSKLRKDAIATLQTDIQTLIDNPETKIQINSHCDSRGSKEYNLKLAKRRARSVVSYLKKNGIKRNRIVAVVPLGEGKPINNCVDGVTCDNEAHQLNRRADIILYNPDKSNQQANP